ncbi:MAG: hypothetical protein JO357_11725 [Hyphomicrobiales bacterium]|nr:hypothetical protein [Hyphomicrobiales bacterium]MBV8768923.1 hypothetical protein [Hyphomicrobiales bacterium]MBV9052870.1 hypothetical protein [Hyphomicrobiales bacterium]MBV9137716.1 hypothetical protein [Hyphomicrobiales bacterium]MBV9973967.1 hypothetical protein [Hyphomicrobiales bacterium]
MMRRVVVLLVACLMTGCVAAPPSQAPDYHCGYAGGGYFSCHPWPGAGVPH